VQFNLKVVGVLKKLKYAVQTALPAVLVLNQTEATAFKVDEDDVNDEQTPLFERHKPLGTPDEFTKVELPQPLVETKTEPESTRVHTNEAGRETPEIVEFDRMRTEYWTELVGQTSNTVWGPL
jgi:hypothetical protein